MVDGAAYPAAEDPATTTAATVITTFIGANYGVQVGGAGDINGDGYSDVIVGADGGVYVYQGTASGTAAVAARTIFGTMTEVGFGNAVAGAGDVNGDGYDDIIVGASGYLYDTGRAYLFHGSAGGITATDASEADALLTGEETNSGFGYAVASAGDVNSDGYGDVVVGSYVDDGDDHSAYVFYGSAGGIAATGSLDADAAITATSEAFSYAVASAGDVNADGYDDLAVGDWLSSGTTGITYVFHGSASGIAATSTSDADSTITGELRSDYFGYTLASAGDVNGDGYDDLVVGAGRYAWYVVSGHAYVFLGSASGITATSATEADAELTGFVYQNFFSGAVASAGDLDGDGYDEIAVGACEYDPVGEAYVFHGSASGITATDASEATPTITGAGSHSYFGCSLAPAGDTNGDGYDDLLVGDTYYPYGYYTYGRAYVFLGSTSGVEATSAADADADLEDEASTPSAIGSGASAGDLNGDGYDDLVIGTPGVWWSDAGRAYVYYGSASGVVATTLLEADVELEGLASADAFGDRARGAGDLNGDGYDDLIVGSPGYSDDTGRAYVFLGSASGITATSASEADSTLTGEAGAASRFGQVAPAGDVNGDGYDDVAIGANKYGGLYTGRVYLFYGSASGITTVDVSSADATLIADGSYTFFGRDLGSAGDVNGDGYDDLVVGAFGTRTPEGYLYVFYGSAGGITATRPSEADSIIEGESGSYLGGSVASGDVNGDGYSDIVVGADGYSTTGRAYVFLGSASGIAVSSASDADTTLTGEEDSWFADEVACGADFNGDGYDDVAIGADQYDDMTGAAYVFYGSASGIAATSSSEADLTLTGEPGADSKFSGVASAGDLNADGSDDLIVVAGSAWPDGALYIYLGGCTDTTAYADSDGDGYGDPFAEVTICGATAGVVLTDDDCDDTDPSVYPGAEELDCTDPRDYNCDGAVAYVDADADGWAACEDCDDTSADVNPASSETPGDGVDSDCDGTELCYADADGDGYRPDDDSTLAGESTACEGVGEALTTDPTGDCDDADPDYHPDAEESDCTDSHDYNCDGSVAYADADADGWAACEDCGDTDAGIHAGATEIPDDGIDQDCDGADATGSTDTAGEQTASADTGASKPEADDTSTDLKSHGCGCASGSASPAGLSLVLVAFVLSRRSFRPPPRFRSPRRSIQPCSS